MSAAHGRTHRRAALLFLLPNLTGFVLFTAWPVAAALILSFTSWDLITPPHWIGFGNFVDLLGFHHGAAGWTANDSRFWQYLGNTLFMMLALPLNMAGSLILALLLNRKLRGTYLYRLVFFFPSVLSGVAMYYLWRWLYNPDFGLINVLLAGLGVKGPNWLASVHWSKPALMIMGSWLAVGGTNMILYLAALQQVSPELHDAAQIDGANAWQRFRIVTWPSIMPVTFFIFTMGIIFGLQSGFDSAYIMTEGGPNGSTTTIGYYIYSLAYLNFKMGYASTVAWVLFALVLGMTIANWKRGGRDVV